MSNRAFFLDVLEDERPRFRRLLGAVVPDRLDWRPEPRARSARELIGHLVGHFGELAELGSEGVVHYRGDLPIESVPEAVELFERWSTEAENALRARSDEAWEASTATYAGDELVWEAPAGRIAWGILFDAIHHRGQLSTYLRPCGGRVPSIYGTSGDEAGG